LIQCYLLLRSVRQQLLALLDVLSSLLFKTSVELRLENLALRHQLGVLRRSAPKAAEAEACRSDFVGVVASNLDGLEIRPADREARDGHRLASQGLSSVLDLESAAREARAPGCAAGGS
jgi:hypothetical protein